jgi:CHAT domain-containing protein
MSDIGKLTYHDFEVELAGLQQNGTYTVRVLGTTPDSHQMSAGETEQATFKPAEFDTPVRRLNQRGLDKTGLLKLGEQLGDLLLPGHVRAMFDRSLEFVRGKQEGLRLRVRVEPLALAALPWEYALVRRNAHETVPQDFLCLQPDISIVRHIVLGDPVPVAVAKEKYRAVIALASPDGQAELELGTDENTIKSAVQKFDADGSRIDLQVLFPATRDALHDALAGADIFHFSGHGVFDAQSDFAPDGTLRGKGAILLEKSDHSADRYDTELLANALQRADVRLAVLGACNTATRDAGGAWSGVAPGLVRLNVPAVVAMQFKLADTRALHFIAPLYLLTLQGYTVDQAVAEARIALFNQTGQANGDWAKDRDWGTPVLYLRTPDGVLFPEPKQQTETVGPDGTPIITARQKIDTVSGTVIGIEAGHVRRGVLTSDQVIKVVKKGATVIGQKHGTIG